jgi:hypothetical protein
MNMPIQTDFCDQYSFFSHYFRPLPQFSHIIISLAF